MPGIQVVIDPNDAPLAFSEANGFYLLAPIKCVPAQMEKQWAGNIDSEGELPAGGSTKNAQLIPKVRIRAATEKAFREAQVKLEQKINKLQADGGILRLIYPDGSIIDWEVRDVAGGETLLDNAFIANLRTEDEITFVCAPFGVGEEELVGEFSAEAKRLLECIVEGIGGSALALARAVISSPEADVWDLKWGRESRRLSEATTAKCLYAASVLAPLGGATATTATVDGKAGTSVVRQGTLTPNWTAMLSTGQLTHEGVYEVFAWVHMPATNTGEVAVGWEYGVGDLLHPTEGDAIYFAADHSREGKVIQLSLGEVFLRASGNGPHQWEGRILAKSSVVGDKFDVLDFGLRPLPEGNGSVSIEPSFNQPAALLMRDEFNQGAGVLNGKPLAAIGSQTGPLTAATAADAAGVGESTWEEPTKAQAIDSSAARAQVSLFAGSKGTHFLKLTNFGFALPSTATIEGIKFEIAAAKNNLNNNGEVGVQNPDVADLALRAVKGGTVQASDFSSAELWYSTYPTEGKGPFPFRTYGGPGQLFGASWLYSDINSSGFGVAIAAYCARGGGGAGGNYAYVDGARATVYWSDSAGNKWVTSGDAVDLAVEEAGHTVQRTEVSDADINTGRYAVAGTTVISDTVVGIKTRRDALKVGSSERIRGGAMARYVDNNNWLYFGPDVEAPSAPVTDRMRVIKRVAGTVTELDKITIPEGSTYRFVWLQVDRRGRYLCWGTLLESGVPRLISAGQDNDLKEGGVLDDGKLGFQDAKTGANANTRNYDQFVAWVPPLDAVIYQGLSLELTHDSCRRLAQGGGGVWTDVIPRGDYLKLAPAGMENRKNRLVFIPSVNDPDTMGVGFPSKLKVAIYATPRYRTVPDPA